MKNIKNELSDPTELPRLIKATSEQKDENPLEGIGIREQDNETGDEGNILDSEDKLLNTPVIPEEVYSLLPSVLKDGLALFSSSRERDVFLTSALAVTSGCFPSVYGIYDQQKVHPNLFSMVIAPPASGKSAMRKAKELCSGIHTILKTQPCAYLTQNPESEAPVFGNFLFMPGNISSAGMIGMLKENNGIGIICETETDTLSNVLKQEWGDFSHLLRQAFHHETISKGRKKEFIEISNPKVSVALTGTFSQLKPFMKSIYDGLFSRFIFYTYKNIPKWRDPSSKPNFVYETYMQGLQDRIKSMYDCTKGNEYCFDLTIPQWDKLNRLYAERLRKTVAFQGEETSATIYRLGLIHFRIAMTLSILRFFEKNPTGSKITCDDLDYSIAELLSDLYLRHGLLVYSFMMREKNKQSDLGSNVEKFFNSLPIIPFRRKDAVAAGEILGLAERTVSEYLKRLKQAGLLKQEVAQGEYQKILND
jgi:DNA-binding transcriptional ArsR family regulator